MSLREEMDDHNVPKGTRPKIFMWGLMGGWSTASILLVILINCFISRVKDAKEDKEKAQKSQAEVEEIARSFMRNYLRAEAGPLMQDVHEYKKSADSLVIKADTLKIGI